MESTIRPSGCLTWLRSLGGIRGASENRVIDYAVVGAGCAGTYVAYRLAKERPEQSVELFEASARVGGRLLTVRVPGMTHRAELGGMRFTDKQPWINGLVGHLGLRETPFDYPLEAWYVRGRHLRGGSPSRATCDHCGGPEGLPYSLLKNEPTEFDALIRRAISEALREAFAVFDTNVLLAQGLTNDSDPQTITPDQWAFIKRHVKFHDRSLYEVGFWNLLQWYLGSEAFLFLHDALGYESVLANWNAAEALPWFLADFVAAYRTLGDGMDTLPITLADRGVGEERIRRFHELETITRGPGDTLDLGFRLTKPNDRGHVSVRARNLILAIPQAPLKRISERNQFNLGGLLNAVTAHPLFKLFLGYERPWWAHHSAIGKEFGKAVTDLPIRQVYYFPRSGHPGPSESRAALMASYSDEHYVDFWRPLLIRKPFYYTGELLDDSEDGRLQQSHLAAFGVWSPLVKKAQRQLRQLHPDVPDMPEPYVALMFDWTERRRNFGGGWHTWNVHERPWQVMRSLIRPLEGLNVHICGEAFSTDQGWVEGALQSAELVLRALGLGRPQWLPATDYNRLDLAVSG